MAPSFMTQYTIEGINGFDDLVRHDKVPVPKVGDNDVLVKIEAVSLNYRDIAMPKGLYPYPLELPVVPGSDGAGTVEAVGARVTRFKPGDKVVTLFAQGWVGGELDRRSRETCLGQHIDGVIREYAAYNEQGLVHCPASLSSIEAATLSCAGLTSWNALYGMPGKVLKPGDTVLVQGTGGVSMFALQFAKAAGATVIATTSSDAKMETLRKLGADHVINYKTMPEWGAEAKRLTDGEGADHVLDVGGPLTFQQSLNAVRLGGVVTEIGFLGGTNSNGEGSSFNSRLPVCSVRRILVGSRNQMEDMCRAIEANPQKLKPVVDSKIFTLDETHEAFQYLWDQKHFGKVCIAVS